MTIRIERIQEKETRPDFCKLCGTIIDKKLPFAVIEIIRAGKSKKYYLCEAHANELEYHFIPGKLRTKG